MPYTHTHSERERETASEDVQQLSHTLAGHNSLPCTTPARLIRGVRNVNCARGHTRPALSESLKAAPHLILLGDLRFAAAGVDVELV
eukprot:7767005-Pyramimonas_sp.AAC.2